MDVHPLLHRAMDAGVEEARAGDAQQTDARRVEVEPRRPPARDLVVEQAADGDLHLTQCTEYSEKSALIQ